MITVPQIVEGILKNSPILSENFEQGLINYSELARTLKPKIEQKLLKSVTPGSIVMALKRLKLGSLNSTLSLTLNKITDLSVRTNLIALTFTNSPTLFNNQSKLLEAASQIPNSFITIANGIYETSIFISSNLVNHAEDIFHKETRKLKVDGLSSITLILPEEAVDTPGIHFSVFKKLFSNGINVFDTATSFTELTIFLKSEDTEKAFGVLKKIN